MTAMTNASVSLGASSPDTGIDRVVLTGDLDRHSVADLRISFSSIIQAAGDQIEVDLSGVNRSNNVGLSLLLCYTRKAKKLNKSITFVNVPDFLSGMAKVSGVDEVLALA